MSEPIPPASRWGDGLTPDVLETIVHRAIVERDFVALRDALEVLAVRDPRRAEILHDTIKVGLELGRRRDGR